MKNAIVCVFSTFPDMQSAERVADALVAEGLAACVQIGAAVESRYVWKGELCREREYPVLIKAAADRLYALRERFHSLHSYECSEWVCVEAEASEAYFNFVSGATLPEK